MFKCPFCNSEMIWGNDHSYNDVYGEGEGIITIYSCSNCNCIAEFTLREDEEE